MPLLLTVWLLEQKVWVSFMTLPSPENAVGRGRVEFCRCGYSRSTSFATEAEADQRRLKRMSASSVNEIAQPWRQIRTAVWEGKVDLLLKREW